MPKTVHTVIWFRYLHFLRSHVPTLTSRTIEKCFPKKACCHSVCFRATNPKDHSIVKVIQVVIFFIDVGGQLSWVNGSLNSPSQKGHGLKHLGETHCWNLISWIFFLRRPRESVAQFWTHARCRHTEPHRAAATPVQTQLEARGESHRVSQRLEIRKRRQVKPWILFGSFFLRLSKLNYFLNKKVCGEVDGMPMTSMTIQLGSRICLWNGQLYAPSKGTSLMLNMCI